MSKFIEPQDLIVPYEAPDLFFSAERVTHVLNMSRNEIKQQLHGFYAMFELKGGL